jgi:cell division protein FtsB
VARRKPEPKTAPKRRRRRLRLGRLGAVVAVVIAGYLYYRPLTNWLHTRSALAQQTSQVRALAAQKAELEREVALATSAAQLVRSARRIGLVKPGERLFIVKGIREWRRAHPQSR